MVLFVVPTEEPDDDGPTYSEGAIREAFDSIDDFNEYLTNHFFGDFAGSYIPKFAGEAGNDLHLLPAVTELSRSKVIEYLASGDLSWEETIEYGETVTLLIDDLEKGTGAYLAMDETDGYFILYSNLPKRQYVDSPLVNKLRRLPNTSRLHVSSTKLENLVEERLEGADPTDSSAPYSTEVIFKRPRGSDVASPVGREVKRTLNYYGRDAAEVIPHLTKEFGMQVDSIRLVIPKKVAFKINRDGVLKLESGAVEQLFEEISDIMQETLDVKKAYAETETQEITLGDQTVSQSTPAKISFNRQGITADTIRDLFAAFTKHGMVPIDRYVESDELYYSTSVYYVTKQEYFDIRGDVDSLRLFPRDEEKDLKSFFRVFRVIQNHVSPDATVAVDAITTSSGGNAQ